MDENEMRKAEMAKLIGDQALDQFIQSIRDIGSHPDMEGLTEAEAYVGLAEALMMLSNPGTVLMLAVAATHRIVYGKTVSLDELPPLETTD
jgi:hypothetical protein